MLIQVSREQDEHLIHYFMSNWKWYVACQKYICFLKLHILDISTICYPVDHIHETGGITLLINETLIDMSDFNVITQNIPHTTV